MSHDAPTNKAKLNAAEMLFIYSLDFSRKFGWCMLTPANVAPN